MFIEKVYWYQLKDRNKGKLFLNLSNSQDSQYCSVLGEKRDI